MATSLSFKRTGKHIRSYDSDDHPVNEVTGPRCRAPLKNCVPKDNLPDEHYDGESDCWAYPSRKKPLLLFDQYRPLSLQVGDVLIGLEFCCISCCLKLGFISVTDTVCQLGEEAPSKQLQ